jgi:ribosomal silencing factor RsfS
VVKVEAVTKPERYKVKTRCCHFTEKEAREESGWMVIERGRLIITGTNEDGSPQGMA